MSKLELLKASIEKLFPPGQAFDNRKGLAEVLAAEASNISEVLDKLEHEVDPRRTVLFKENWQGLVGGKGNAELHARFTRVGDNTAKGFKALVSSLNSNIKVEEHSFEPFRVGSEVGDRIYDDRWIFVLLLESFPFAGGKPDPELRAIIEDQLPSHLIVVYEE